MKVLAFAASSSKNSINKKLVTYASSLIEDAEVEILDLNDFALPLFSEDKEKELGQPELAKLFMGKIEGSDAILISFAEHNGAYTAAYKNLFDWCSRINPKVYQKKPMVLFATSPGGRGGATVLELATSAIPRFDGDVKASLAIPNFYDNFDVDSNHIKNDEIKKQVHDAIATLL